MYSDGGENLDQARREGDEQEGDMFHMVEHHVSIFKSFTEYPASWYQPAGLNITAQVLRLRRAVRPQQMNGPSFRY
jgi:hypothetical protein